SDDIDEDAEEDIRVGSDEDTEDDMMIM
nr:hypothetical protein [Tanacetum cinerariifolium]